MTMVLALYQSAEVNKGTALAMAKRSKRGGADEPSPPPTPKNFSSGSIRFIIANADPEMGGRGEEDGRVDDNLDPCLKTSICVFDRGSKFGPSKTAFAPIKSTRSIDNKRSL